MEDFNSQSWIDEIRRLPELEELKSRLNTFFSLNLAGKSQSEIRKLYFEHCNLFPYVLDDSWAVEMMNSLVTYRVRNKVNQEVEDITAIETFRYPPDEYCNSNGRANLKNNSVFYGAFDPSTSILETKPENEEIQYFTTWKNRSNEIPFLASFLPFDLPMKNLFKEYSIKKYLGIEIMCNKIGVDKSQELIELQGTFAKWFQTEIDPYHVTSWIANTYINTHNVDFLIYPSVQMDSKTFCIAFSKVYVDRNMILDRVIEYKISGINNSKAKINLLKAGSYIDGRVEYNEPTMNDIKLMNLT